MNVSIGGMRWALELFATGVFFAALALGARFVGNYTGGLALMLQDAAEVERTRAQTWEKRGRR